MGDFEIKIGKHDDVHIDGYGSLRTMIRHYRQLAFLVRSIKEQGRHDIIYEWDERRSKPFNDSFNIILKSHEK